MSFQGWSERPLRSVWVTSDPSGSRRSRSPSRADTISRRPSGSQSMQNGNAGMRTMTSLLPSRLTAMTSCAPQSENQRRSSCQRGDSPNTMPVIRVCSSATYLLLSSGTRAGLDGTVLMFEMSASITDVQLMRACLALNLLKLLVGNAPIGDVDSRRGHGAGQVRGREGGHVVHVLERLNLLEHARGNEALGDCLAPVLAGCLGHATALQ